MMKTQNNEKNAPLCYEKTRAAENGRTRMSKPFGRILRGTLTALCITLSCQAYVSKAHSSDHEEVPSIRTGEGEFNIQTQRGPVTVYTYKPTNFSASSPIWIVMPGARRDAYRHIAFDYYDVWDGLAKDAGALLLVPEFTKERWPGSWRYQTGNVRTPKLRPVRWTNTSFNVVERVFKKAVRLTGSHKRKFNIFGHGAGAQFVQRYVLHSGGRYIDKAIAANPGWYMLPDYEYKFPYGLKGAPIPAETLRRSFKTDFVLLLGTADTNRAQPLRTNAFTRRQGSNRYARGHFYFSRARNVAARLGTGFRWKLREVDGVAHDQKNMAPPAAELFTAWN